MTPLPPTITPLAFETKSGPAERPRVQRAKDLRRAAGQIGDENGGGSPRDVKSGALADAEPGIGDGFRGATAFGWAVAPPHCKTLRPATVVIVAIGRAVPVYVTAPFAEKLPGRLFAGGAAYAA